MSGDGPGHGGESTSPAPRTVWVDDLPGQDPIELVVPAGAQLVTPASRIAIRTVVAAGPSLRGVGLDWGAGTGGLAIAAARSARVRHVYAIDVDRANVDATVESAHRNGVGGKVTALWADGFSPRDDSAATILTSLAGALDFIVANPPGSTTGDGLDWRRLVLDGGRRLLRPGAPVLLQISRHYGRARISGLAGDGSGYVFAGTVGSSGWEPFDLKRPDLAELMRRCVAIERSGGAAYTFGAPPSGEHDLTAVQAFERYGADGESPLTRWQVHEFLRVED